MGEKTVKTIEKLKQCLQILIKVLLFSFYYQYIDVRYLNKKEFRSKLNDSSKIKHYICNNVLDLEKIINDFSAYVGAIIDNMSKHTISNEDKEEICSDVFFILWKNTYKLDINKVMSSYIAGVTRNIVKDYLKKNKILYDISDYENDLYSYDKIDLLDSNIEEIIKIEKKIDCMKEIDKRVFLDFYYSSKSIKDIAKEQKMSEFNIKQRLYRIRNKIRKEVSK